VSAASVPSQITLWPIRLSPIYHDSGRDSVSDILVWGRGWQEGGEVVMTLGGDEGGGGLISIVRGYKGSFVDMGQT